MTSKFKKPCDCEEYWLILTIDWAIRHKWLFQKNQCTVFISEYVRTLRTVKYKYSIFHLVYKYINFAYKFLLALCKYWGPNTYMALWALWGPNFWPLRVMLVDNTDLYVPSVWSNLFCKIMLYYRIAWFYKTIKLNWISIKLNIVEFKKYRILLCIINL